jgi:multiple antibiotic resistance protein
VHDIAQSFLLVYAGLFPIVNPLGSAPIFLALTSNHSEAMRRLLARRVAINGFLLLLGSLLIGSHVLEFFGITLPVLRIGGGLAVASFGWRLLRDGVEPTHNPGEVDQNAPVDAFYPLTMPLTVDPGVMSVAVTIGANHSHVLDKLAIQFAAAIIGTSIVTLCILLTYHYAERFGAWIGHTGMNIVVRLSAFIVLSIGVQIAWNGVKTLLKGVGISA